MDESDPGAAAVAAEERDNLWSLAAEVLSSDQRSALWLRYGEGLEPAEIARILAKRPSTVRVLLFRARERLANHMEDESVRAHSSTRASTVIPAPSQAPA